MNQNDLKKFSKLYFYSQYMGANIIFRRYYDLPSDTIIPLSIPHGVDYGQCFEPMDVHSAEPIHWSHNLEIHRLAKKIKPSLLMPHPWLMITENQPTERGKGVLIIGPPPSPHNDQNLFKLVENNIDENWSILIKARGNYQESMNFWRIHGVKPITASNPDFDFYFRFYELIKNFETIVGCAFSSALIFAASIKKEIRLIAGYKYQVYANTNIQDQIDFNSKSARSFVKIFIDNNQDLIQKESLKILGAEVSLDKKQSVINFNNEVLKLKKPYWDNPDCRIPYQLREKMAIYLNKPSILKLVIKDYLEHLKRKQVSIMDINELDVWENGSNSLNFQLELVKNIVGVTIAGVAPNGYGN